jgi:hypothetical protein
MQIPHVVQQVMSGESTPILVGAIPSFEMLMTTWEELAEKNPKLKRWINIGLHWATTYYSRMDHTSSYIMAMGSATFTLLIFVSILKLCLLQFLTPPSG